jgi:hypothetical protein
MNGATSIDISHLIRAAISLGFIAAIGLLGRKREDIMRRFDDDPAFQFRVVALINIDMAKALSAAIPPTKEVNDRNFKALIDSIIAEADKPSAPPRLPS